METPEKSELKGLTVRLPAALLTQLREAARAHHRSLNGEIVTALENHLRTCKHEGERNRGKEGQ